MLGYWLGAVLDERHARVGDRLRPSGHEARPHTAKKTVSPAIDLALAAISLAAGLVLATGRDEPLEERRAQAQAGQEAAEMATEAGKGDAQDRVRARRSAVDPGASYLAALDRLGKRTTPTAADRARDRDRLRAGAARSCSRFPTLAFAIAPRRTPMAIDRVKSWAGTHWRRYAAAGSWAWSWRCAGREHRDRLNWCEHCCRPVHPFVRLSGGVWSEQHGVHRPTGPAALARRGSVQSSACRRERSSRPSFRVDFAAAASSHALSSTGARPGRKPSGGLGRRPAVPAVLRDGTDRGRRPRRDGQLSGVAATGVRSSMRASDAARRRSRRRSISARRRRSRTRSSTRAATYAFA